MGLAIMGLAVVGLSGCSDKGPERAALQGQVTFDGQPVESGAITLVPTDGTTGPSSGAAIKEGKYTIPADSGPVPGNYRVEIIATRKTGKQTAPMPGQPVGGPSGAAPVDDIEMFVPPQYNRQSKLKIEVKSGENQEDFTLSSRA
jgi:hypothetical protein